MSVKEDFCFIGLGVVGLFIFSGIVYGVIWTLGLLPSPWAELSVFLVMILSMVLCAESGRK